MQYASHLQFITAYPGAYGARRPGGFTSADLNINCRCAMRAALPDEKGNSFEQDTKIWEAREMKRQGYEVIVRKYVRMIFAIQKRTALARLSNNP